MKAIASLWPRLTELALAAWLAIAPWWLEAPAILRMHDGVAAVAIAVVTSGALVQQEGRLNLYNVLIALWLAAFALFWSRSLHAPTAQNELLTGLSLLMFAIIPSRTMHLPQKWRDFYLRHPQTVEEERRAVATQRDGSH